MYAQVHKPSWLLFQQSSTSELDLWYLSKHYQVCVNTSPSQLSAHIQSLNFQQNVSLSIAWRLMYTCRMKGSHATSHKPLFTSWATPLTATPCNNIQPISLSTMPYWTNCTGLNRSRPHMNGPKLHTTHSPFKTGVKRRRNSSNHMTHLVAGK